MPVRSLNSSVLKWPDAETVEKGLRSWAEKARSRRPDLLRIGYFGSYARGDAGVGSDLDVILVVEKSDEPFEKRGIAWDTTDLPVQADLLVYTRTEFEAIPPESRFGRVVREEAVWL
jgi:predicted nucleotidyltransferase